MFEPLPPKFSFPEAEKRVLAFWDEHDIFAASIELRKDAPRFVFYEGPPTANGMPHPGHCLTRAMKDIFPRYQTMCGRLVERKGGWDTHGLPVEREVCKELGLKTKQDIEAFGVEKFNLKCIQSVFRYTREWEEMTRRLGYWVDLEQAYVTYHQSYVESVWWSLKTLFERGVLYQGHKVVWWWAQGGTALSSGEVGEGYKTVDDPSVFVKFPLVDDERTRAMARPSSSGTHSVFHRRDAEAPHFEERTPSVSSPSGLTPSGSGSIGVPPVRAESHRGVLKAAVRAALWQRSRILPHWEAGGSTYFLTFRLLEGELSPNERSMVLAACRHWDAQRILLHAAVVMPDHVHLLCTPLEKSKGEWWSIADLMHSIKGFTAKELNRLRGTGGLVWQREYFDRIIRNESDFEEKWNYIVTNPQRRDLPESYEWVWVEPSHAETHRRDADAPRSGGASPGSGSVGVSPAPGEVAFGGQARPRISLLVWTTTPWTLISNQFAAVNPELEYALVHDPVDDEYLIIARDLVEQIARKARRELRIVSGWAGSALTDLRYLPPFPEAYYKTRASSVLYFERGSALQDAGRLERNETLGETRTWLAFDETDGIPDDAPEAYVGWRILEASFVTTDSGTGLVHQAPAFGEADFDLWRTEARTLFSGLPLLNAVSPDGTFSSDAPERYRGRWVKDCDKDIIRELRDERKTPWGTPLLYHQEQYRHEYPFCPQSPDDPLIQYPRAGWFVRTSAFKDEFLANNATINWLPEHIKEGRFGDFLRNNVDWALSRERYWGTPLPIWKCESCGKMEAIGSFAELRGKPGATDGGYWERKVAEHKGEEFPEHLRVHKPYIDEWTYECAACSSAAGNSAGSTGAGSASAGSMGAGSTSAGITGVGGPVSDRSFSPEGAPTEKTGRRPVPQRMRRVPEVIDCWWDAGSMPFAQWGFPHAPGSVTRFSARFPADFISEAIDQTRGWFYALIAINTLLFSKTKDVFEHGQKLARAHLGDLYKRAGDDIDAPSHWWNQSFEDWKGGEAAAEGAWHLSCDCEVDPNDEFERNLQTPFAIAANYPLPFKTCIVLGHIAGEDGNKMSKKLRNYKEPSYIFDGYGADAMRWYFFSAQAPWTSVRFQEAAIRDAQREFLVKLYNVLSFFTIYANIDGFDPRRRDEPGNPMAWRPTEQRGELDRWVVTELHRTVREVRAAMDRFENFPAAQRLNDFVEALSNWYVRRSRDRFWRGAKDQDKWDAYHTLYGCLLTTAQLIAPFTPFFAETMYQILTGSPDAAAAVGTKAGDPFNAERIFTFPRSVHLCNYPTPEDIRYHDDALSDEMDMVREIASLGRAARSASTVKEAKKVRQPLARVEVILAKGEHADWLESHKPLIAEELNVKAVEFTSEGDQYVTYKVVPNFPAIGKKYRALVPGIKAALGALKDAGAARKTLVSTGTLPLSIDGQSVVLTPEEVEIRLDAKPGWSAAQGRVGVVVLSTELTSELREEGLVREFIHYVQAARKDQNLAYEARIAVHVEGPAEFLAVLKRFDSVIRNESLAETLTLGAIPGGVAAEEIEVEAVKAKLSVIPRG